MISDGLRYYDIFGNQIDRWRWAELFEDLAYKTVEVTDMGSPSHPELADTRVSTVWLGIDHGYGGGPPIIFETMVFSPIEEWDGVSYRYTTHAEAVEGHQMVVAELRASVS